ncbi:DUF3558 domain-containing protein [Mycobacterium sp. CBMA271]|uniref:hypothetical protein n=1 Tax=unclassified Mycobacteroides TaxID=2618759 RepID=UPI0012DF409F|nr:MULTISPECIES: hypothetical protein [unclassified Mycobacteroides]MUM15438.1 hypothetical protein [Mycobacteroides sp. CBMA 326]MUM21338.1 DUF3558 domain-containing protein [Mycobacteroides sp. CBMA 271]
MRIVACLGVLLLLTGCTQSTDGEALSAGTSAASTGPRPPSYREKLDWNDRADRDRAAQIRAVDPCSMINVDAAGALGKVRYVGANRAPQICSIDFDVPMHDVGVMEPVPGFVSRVAVGDRKTGRANVQNPSGGECSIGLPAGYGDELVVYTIWITGGTRNGCGELQPVVDASRDLVRRPALRTDSKRLPPSKLVRLDPCDVIDAVAPGRDIQLITRSAPFDCDFKDKGDRLDETRLGIRWWLTELEDAPHPATEGPEYTRIRGALTHFKDDPSPRGSGRYCRVESYVGLENPITGHDETSALPQWVEMFATDGHDEQIGCPRIMKAVEAAIRMYQEAP